MGDLGVTAELQAGVGVSAECGASGACTEWLLSTPLSVPATEQGQDRKTTAACSTVWGGGRTQTRREQEHNVKGNVLATH